MPHTDADYDDDRDPKKKGSSKKDVSHVPCKFFKVGSCTAGPACPFSHSVNEPGQQKQVCSWFVKGSCKFGHKCALAHVLPGQPMSMDRKNKKTAQQSAAAGGGDKANGTVQEPSSSTHKGPSDKPRERGHRGKHSDPNAASLKENPSNGSSSSSSSNLRPGMASKAPASISASVPAPPVLRDTSADFTFGLPDEVDHHTKSPLSPQPTLPTAQQHLRQQHTGTTATPPSNSSALLSVDASAKTPQASAIPLDNGHSNYTPDEHQSPSGTPGRRHSPLPPYPAMPIMRHAPRSSDLGFGPVGSPPRAIQPSGLAAQRASASISNNGPGALSNILAGLAISHGIGSGQGNGAGNGVNGGTGFSPSTSPATKGFAMEGISSSLSNANSNFGNSPFSAPGSKSLFIPYGESSSAVASSPMRSQLSSAYPASFAGARGGGWDQMNRRPSLPGQNVIRHDLASSAALLLDDSALEEEDLEAEEFLPSSLNELLTNEERERRYSRTRARPTIPNEDWSSDKAPAARSPSVERVHMMHSRSVPAQSLMNNVKALWDSPSTGQGGADPMESSRGFGRTVSSNSAIGAGGRPVEDLFLYGSHGPSPSLLSTSNMSNASNAFLRAGPQNSVSGMRGFSGLESRLNGTGGGLTSPTEANFHPSASYNPQGALSAQYNTLQQKHSSISRPLYPTSNNQVDSNSSAFYGLHQPAHQQHPTAVQVGPGAGMGGAATAQGGGMSILSPTTRAMRSHAHEPGSSLPRGLGAGLSRLHLVPMSAMPLSPNVDQSKPAGSPGFVPAGAPSPSYAAAVTAASNAWPSSSDFPRTASTTSGGFPSTGAGAPNVPVSSSFSGKIAGGETNDLQSGVRTGASTLSAQNRNAAANRGSSLSARLAAAGGATSLLGNAPSGIALGMGGTPAQGGMAAPSVPVPPATSFTPGRRSAWGDGGVPHVAATSARGHDEDRDVDEELFSMD